MMWMTVEFDKDYGLDMNVRSAVELATKMNTGVKFFFSGREVKAFPNDIPIDVIKLCWACGKAK